MRTHANRRKRHARPGHSEIARVAARTRPHGAAEWIVAGALASVTLLAIVGAF